MQGVGRERPFLVDQLKKGQRLIFIQLHYRWCLFMHGHAAPERAAYFWKQQLVVMANQRRAQALACVGVDEGVFLLCFSLSSRSQWFHWVIEDVSKRHSLNEDTPTWTLSGRSSAAQLLKAKSAISSWRDTHLSRLWPCRLSWFNNSINSLQTCWQSID